MSWYELSAEKCIYVPSLSAKKCRCDMQRFVLQRFGRSMQFRHDSAAVQRTFTERLLNTLRTPTSESHILYKAS